MSDGPPQTLPQAVVVRSAGRTFTATVHDGEIMLPKGFTPPRGARRTQAGRQRGNGQQIRLGRLNESAEYSSEAVTKRVVGVLGNNTVAALLGVSKDRPSRWATGQDSPSPVNRLQLVDLDSLVGHLLAVFTPGQAVLWLEGQDPHLNARPIDVYRIDGAAPVIGAMKAFEQGAFA